MLRRAYQIGRTVTYGAASGMAFVVGVMHGRLEALLDAESTETMVDRERHRYAVARRAFCGIVRRAMRTTPARADEMAVEAGFHAHPGLPR